MARDNHLLGSSSGLASLAAIRAGSPARLFRGRLHEAHLHYAAVNGGAIHAAGDSDGILVEAKVKEGVGGQLLHAHHRTCCEAIALALKCFLRGAR